MNKIKDIINTQNPKARKRILHSSIFLIVLISLVGAIGLLVHVDDNAQAASGDIIVFYDGAVVPNGWSCLSCNSSQPFFNVFPRGSSTYGAASTSADSHGHSASFATHTIASATTTGDDGAGTAVDPANHTHTVSGLSVSSTDHRPPFKNLKLISANTSTLPAGAIAMFDVASTSLPANWSYYSDMEGNYLRGESATTTGGAADHRHTINASADATTATQNNRGPADGTVSGPNHTHNISGSSTAASNTPPYVEVTFGKLSVESSIPVGMIALFDAAPPTNWTSLSGAGGDFNGRFIRGAGNYGFSSGTATHVHGTSTVVGDVAPESDTSRAETTEVALSTHTHDFTFNNFSTQSSLPTYRDVIVAKYEVAQLTQQHYRWYENVNTSTPSIALAAEDATGTNITQNEIIRLRINLEVSSANLESSTRSFKLQFAEKGGFGSCASVPGGNFADVGGVASTTIWRGANNALPEDGEVLPSTLLASSTVAESYEEENPSTSTPVTVPIGGLGEWDWVIQNNGAKSEAAYCFRMVNEDGSELFGYTNYPEVTVVGPLTQIRYRWRNDDGGE